jgi:hypothetical protein
VTHFTRFIQITIMMTCVSLLPTSAVGEKTGCNRQDAIRAESEASTLQSWQRVFDSYQRYRKCDDAAVSEGYSSVIASLLATHWEQTTDLLDLLRAHPAFERFVLRHLDDTMTREQDAQIQRNVTTACPQKGVQFCAAVGKRFVELNSQPNSNTSSTNTH